MSADNRYYKTKRTLKDDQLKVFDRIMEKIDKDEPIKLFVSGTAGTGKSFLINAIIDAVGYPHVFVCAPTGLAAKLVDGKTIHSFFNLPIIAEEEPTNGTMREVKTAVLKLVIIDEVSMCSAEMLDRIEEKMSLIRRNAGPFGGFSIVLFGDLLQIPPVKAEWVFKSKLWTMFEYAELQQNVRQLCDPEFAQMLQRWRVGKITTADRTFLQSKCIVKKGPGYFDRVSDAFKRIEKGDSLVLTHRNVSASEINKRVIRSKFGSPLSNVSAVYHRIIDENVCERILVHQFQIACGTKVMINENLPCGLRNGEIARIVEIHADKNQNVERVDLMPTSSHIVQTVHRRVKRREVGAIERQAKLYLPFIPAYAATFHKAQGQTLDRVVLELSASKMDAGLFFVGASRVRCGDDFYITNYHKNFQIKVNCEARDEYNRLRLLINLPPI